MCPQIRLAQCLGFVLTVVCSATPIVQSRAGDAKYSFELLREGAVIARDDPKTCFPSVIRVPDWLSPEERANPAANYYLYYCSHHGDHIRLKWASDLDGLWHEYNIGARANGYAIRGVFDVRADPTRFNYGHLAAPDVHVDDANRRFIMVYHGQDQPATKTRKGDVVDSRHANFVTLSKDGLNFQAPEGAGGQAGYGPVTVSYDGVTRDVCLGPSYMRVFPHHGTWYSVSKRGVLCQARSSSHPWSTPDADVFGIAWLQEATPSRLWEEDAKPIQGAYHSPAATFLASSEFANHPNNPNPGVRIDCKSERMNHLCINKLNDSRLEVVFYIKKDPEDRYRDLYRVVYDISDPNFENWELARGTDGRIIFDVLLRPEDVIREVRKFHPTLKPMYHADPVSLGSSYIFVDQDGQKYLFFAYVSEALGGDEGEGQITGVRLVSSGN